MSIGLPKTEIEENSTCSIHDCNPKAVIVLYEYSSKLKAYTRRSIYIVCVY